MGEILNSGMMWRGYNTADPTNDDVTLVAGTATTVVFDQTCNRLIVANYSPYPVAVKFGGTAATQSEWDVWLQPRTTFAGGVNFNGVSLYSAYPAHVAYFAFREDNTAP